MKVQIFCPFGSVKSGSSVVLITYLLLFHDIINIINSIQKLSIVTIMEEVVNIDAFGFIRVVNSCTFGPFYKRVHPIRTVGRGR